MIRSLYRRAALAAAFAGAAALSPANAQTLETPAPSPKARVEQRVGITDFSVDYSSPGVKGRKIFGGLVPYDQMWRTGANAATKLAASRDFTFGTVAVPKGTYTLMTIPGASSWVVVLNKNLEVNTPQGYDTKDEVARITVAPQSAPARERLTFVFSNTTDASVSLDLEWDTVRVSIPIKVDTQAQVMSGIDAALADAWRPHYQAGRYLFENGGSLDTALQYLDTSIGIKSTWWNNWFRAQVLGKKGKNADAVASAEKTLELGKGNDTFEQFFKADVQKALDGWKKAKS